MKTRGLILAALHLALTMTVAAKYFYDRQTLPHAWVRALPYDPKLPVRGRYVRIEVEAAPGAGWKDDGETAGVQLRVENGRLLADRDAGKAEISGRYQYGSVRILKPLAYFIPENVPDPSRRAADEELWADVTVPPSGQLRPIRLGVKKHGELAPLALN